MKPFQKNYCRVITSFLMCMMMMMALPSNAFLMSSNNNLLFTKQHQTSFHLNSSFEQLPGESDIDFIHRVTSQSKAMLEESSSSSSTFMDEEEEEVEQKPKGKYQPIEEWDAERKAKGEMSWEEKVMFEGQQHGNQVRQNDILLRNLHSF